MLYAEADAAMYRAKELGKNRFAFSDIPDIDQETVQDESPPMINMLDLRTLLNNIGNGIEIMHGSADGQVIPLYINDSLLNLLGRLSRERFNELYGGDALAGVHPDDLPGVLAAHNDATATGSTPMRVSFRTLGAHDIYFPVRMAGT